MEGDGTLKWQYITQEVIEIGFLKNQRKMYMAYQYLIQIDVWSKDMESCRDPENRQPKYHVIEVIVEKDEILHRSQRTYSSSPV